MRPDTRHSAPFRTGTLALAGLLALALSLVAAVRPTATSSAAEPPAARPGYAIVGLFVAGNRISETQVAGVGGATFGFFANRPPEANLDTDTGIVSGLTPVATCTSTADGWCNAEIPIGAGGVAAGTRLWISPTALPAGWASPAYWQTAPLTTTAATRLRTQHVFQTPALQSNGRYVSGTAGWLGDPGTTTTDTAFMNANGGSTGSATTSNNFQRRTSSAGYWPLIESNPSLHTDQCGVNIAFVIDLSSSVEQAGQLNNLKTALANGIDALRGTPSQVALITFGTGSPANGFPNSNTNLMPVASTADAQRVKDQFAGWSTIPTNYTNWDAPLNEVASINQPDGTPNHIDIAIVLTDGNPTVYGDIPGHLTNNPTIPTGSGFTRFRELENATASANRVKAQGTRVVAVGVGDGLDERSSYNLRTISGSHKYAGTGPVLGSDFLQESSYAEAARQLRSLITGLCAPSISVVKQIIPAGGTIADAYTPSDPWTFTASTTTAGASVTPPPSRDTDPATGATNFDVTVPTSSTANFDIAETPQPGYTLRPVSPDGTALDPTGQNAYCTNKGPDGDEPVTVTNVGNGFTVHDMDDEAVVSCVVYNEAPDFTEASVVVHKRWRVTTSAGTTAYDEGQQPEDLQASLRLGGPAPAGLSDQSWSVERHGYRGRDTVTPPGIPGENVAVAEDVNLIPPGCTLTSATMSGTGITGDRDLGTSTPSTTVDDIAQGLNEWTITNSVDCRSHLVLEKRVVNGPAASTEWALHAHGPGSALPGPSGTTGVTSEVTPEAPYQLAEQAGSDPELLNYVQTDLRERPLQWPLSTGSVDCLQTGNGGVEQPGDPIGVQGAVSVPLGQTFTCTFTNTTAPLRVIKDVSGGTADPSDFQFSVEPVSPHPDGLPSRHFAGAAAPGHETIVRPGQTYRISEVDGPPGYQLLSLDCGAVAPRSATHEFTIPAGSSGVCTATNSYSTWTAEKSSDPAPGKIDPGTTITYTLTARHLEGNPTHDVIVTDDIAEVLRHADFVDGSIDASAGTAHRDGDRIVWTIPVLHGVQTVRFQVRVHSDAYGATLSNQLGTHTTGDPSDPDTPAADGDQAVDCAKVTGRPDCASTVHTVVARGAALPGTGGPRLALALGGALALALGSLLVAFATRRRHTS